MRGFLRKIISMEFSEIKKGGFPYFAVLYLRKAEKHFRNYV